MKIRFELLLCFLPLLAPAQDFSFSPGADLTGQMDVDGYGVHQIDIINETGDSLWLTWRLVENTMPEEWNVNLCDNVECYGVMPNTVDMHPVASGSAAFIRITTYPQNFSGSGQLHFRIYRTGFPEEYSTITFTLSAGLTATRELPGNEARVFPNPTSGPVQIEFPASDPVAWILFDVLGQKQLQGNSRQLDLSALPKAQYWLQIMQNDHLILIPVLTQ